MYSRGDIMADEERRKRNPAIERRIAEVKKDDIRVALIGTIIEKDKSINAIVIDDGEANIRVLLPEDIFERFEAGQLVRTIGLVAPALEGDEKEIRGEIVQDFSKLDKELYREYLKL
jgi:hypothetical protein